MYIEYKIAYKLLYFVTAKFVIMMIVRVDGDWCNYEM